MKLLVEIDGHKLTILWPQGPGTDEDLLVSGTLRVLARLIEEKGLDGGFETFAGMARKVGASVGPLAALEGQDDG
jgi:hypothetical protein